KFPFRRAEDLAVLLEENILAARSLLARLGPPTWLNSRPLWSGVSADEVLAFLTEYRVDDEVRSLSMPLLYDYIRRQAG
ncbi:hypothetical protein, partial [Pseudomonas sp. AH2 (2023)]|uniref:hypothetical protein n=1 Tax=Pseudomonas sp. AH2 (2023) TaxID=3048599 RepID=UPI002B23C389